MFSKIFKFILFILIFIVSLIILFTVYTKFFLLDAAFYTSSFNNNGVYENLAKGTRNAASDAFRQKLTSNENFTQMTIEQRQQVEKQVENATSFINKESVKDFIEINIQNFISYLNNKAEILYIYLPIEKWGLPSQTTSNIPEYLKNTNIDVRDILRNTSKNSLENQAFLESIKNFSKYLLYLLIIGIITEVFLVSVYILVSKKGKRNESSGKLFSLLGIVMIILSWLTFTASKIVTEGLIYQTNWSEILTGTLLPIFFQPLIILFTVFGALSLLLGVVLYNKKNKNQLVNEAK